MLFPTNLNIFVDEELTLVTPNLQVKEICCVSVVYRHRLSWSPQLHGGDAMP